MKKNLNTGYSKTHANQTRGLILCCKLDRKTNHEFFTSGCILTIFHIRVLKRMANDVHRFFIASFIGVNVSLTPVNYGIFSLFAN